MKHSDSCSPDFYGTHCPRQLHKPSVLFPPCSPPLSGNSVPVHAWTFYMVINYNIRKRYQSTKGFIRVDIRQRNIINTVPTRKIRIHSRLFCLRTQCSQMFRLQFIYIHKRNQRNHSQEEQWQYKCCFYCQTSLLNLSPKRGAERYFYRRNFSNMFFCICPKIFPTLLGE